MLTKPNTRAQIMAEIVRVAREAREDGRDHWQAIGEAFPGIPSDVQAEAFLAVEEETTEAWWQSVEKTIDGEVIRNALAKGSTP